MFKPYLYIMYQYNQLEAAYKVALLQGDTEVPEDPEDEVDIYHVCFLFQIAA
jgi:hypothetical protein